MKKELICIVCPKSCNLNIQIDNKKILSVKGALCKRGEEYAYQEITNPKRKIASSIKVINGELPLVSIRLSAPIPKNEVFNVMGEIKKTEVHAPIKIGQVLIKNVLGLGIDIIATKNIDKK